MNKIPLKRGLVALGVAATLAVGAAGLVRAQTATPTATPTRTPGQQQADQRSQQFLDTLASKLGVTTDKLKQAIADTRQSLGLPANGRGFGPGFGRGGPGGPGRPDGPGGPGGPGPRGFGPSLDAAAQAIGITTAQLRQEWPGKSLSDVATAHNVAPTEVADALKAAETARIDQAVSNGRLTADQANQAKQQANARIDQLMTQTLPAGGPGGRGGNAGPGPGGRRGAPGAPRAAATPTA